MGKNSDDWKRGGTDVFTGGATMVAREAIEEYNRPAMEAAEAAGAAAQAQLAAARANAGNINAYTNQLAGEVRNLAAMSPQELQAYEGSLAASQRIVDADAKLLASIDPALMEASEQALKLLRGEEAASLGPLRNQRATQRESLLRTLRNQLGPGAETSTAGQKALQQFDLETATLLSGSQQNALGNLINAGGAFMGQRQALGGNAANLANIGTAFGNAQVRQANAALQAGSIRVGGLTNTGAQVTGLAGAPFVQQQLQSQSQMAFNNQLLGLGGTIIGGMFGGPAGAAAGSQIGGAAGGGGGTMSPFTYQSPTFGNIR